MKRNLLLLFLFSTSTLFAQKVVNKEIAVEGKVALAEGFEIPKVNRGYTVWLPETGEIKGLIVFTRSGRDTVNPVPLVDYALSKQLAVLYATTDNRLEFFFEVERMQEIENYIQEVLVEYRIPRDNLLYCGMSLEGTRALKLAMYGQTENSKHKLIPKAIAICDAPLDMVRFHKETTKAKKLNFNAVAANEGGWVSAYLESNLGGTPLEALANYINYSPYSYFGGENKNVSAFKNIAIRAYTEPDVNWWIDTRRKDYYGMNSVDLAGLVNELKILGNEKAELIITQNKGYYSDGTRHPHNWNIVDEKEMVEWFVGMI